MTKQEQIEEMTKIIQHEEEIYPCEDDVIVRIAFALYKNTAEKLYNAGYRKAEEVRKETAEKIFGDLWNNFVEYSSYAMDYTQHLGEYDKNINITVSDVICDIICIAKNYGVDLEVEE